MRLTLIGVVTAGVLVLSTTASAQTPDPAVGRIEVPDRVSDGVAKGAIGMAIIGGVGTGVFEYILCARDCVFSTMKTGLVGVALGGAVGAVLGGLLDAANPERQVIFERTSLNIAPVITGRSRSVSFVVRW